VFIVRGGCGIGLLLMASVALAAGDPMKPNYYEFTGGSLNKAMGALTLDMVLFSEERQLAIVNGKTVKEGDVIEGARVVAIYPHKVSVVRRGKLIDLSLLKNSSTVVRTHIKK